MRADDREITRPDVSVVLPVYNAAATIHRTLSSVIAQTTADFEIVLCDDGSTDETLSIARQLLASECGAPWRIVDAGGVGPGAARNCGIRVSRGEYVAFLDDDDAWRPRKLEACMQALIRSELDLVCHSEIWDFEDGRAKVRKYADLFDPDKPMLVSLMRNNPFSTSALVIKKSRLLEAGMFDEDLPSAEDFDLWLRLAMLPEMKIGFLDEPLGVYTVRSDGESGKVDRRMRALLQIGQRYRLDLIGSARLGRLELWIYLSRVYITSGFRYLRQEQRTRGLGLIVKGMIMWPFRFDWLWLATKERLRRHF